MKILSFDVSGNYSSISLLNDDEVNTFTQTHDRKDRPNWDKLFARVGFDSNEDFDALDALAFACGPGSYTALRITASFLKAIAEAKELPLIAISNFESIALEASQWIDEADAKIYVAIEADLKKKAIFAVIKKIKMSLHQQELRVLWRWIKLFFIKKDDCYFVGTGWPVGAENHLIF